MMQMDKGRLAGTAGYTEQDDTSSRRPLPMEVQDLINIWKTTRPSEISKVDRIVCGMSFIFAISATISTSSPPKHRHFSSLAPLPVYDLTSVDMFTSLVMMFNLDNRHGPTRKLRHCRDARHLELTPYPRFDLHVVNTPRCWSEPTAYH